MKKIKNNTFLLLMFLFSPLLVEAHAPLLIYGMSVIYVIFVTAIKLSIAFAITKITGYFNFRGGVKRISVAILVSSIIHVIIFYLGIDLAGDVVEDVTSEGISLLTTTIFSLLIFFPVLVVLIDWIIFMIAKIFNNKLHAFLFALLLLILSVITPLVLLSIA